MDSNAVQLDRSGIDSLSDHSSLDDPRLGLGAHNYADRLHFLGVLLS
jgi:hypothetical protein